MKRAALPVAAVVVAVLALILVTRDSDEAVRLGDVVDVAVDPDGLVYAIDDDQVVLLDDGDVSAVAGHEPELPASPDDPAAEAGFGNLTAIAAAPDGRLWVADCAASRIIRIDPALEVVDAFVGTSGGCAADVAVDGDGGLWWVEEGRGDVMHLGDTRAAPFASEVAIEAARFDVAESLSNRDHRLTGIDVGPDGAVAVADAGRSEVYRVDPGGEVELLLSDAILAPRRVVIASGAVVVTDRAGGAVLRTNPERPLHLAGRVDGLVEPAALTVLDSGRLLVVDDAGESAIWLLASLQEPDIPGRALRSFFPA